MEGKLHVTLVTSAQPSANPRLVKEAKSLLQAGYVVSVIWCPISTWADGFDHQLFDHLQEINWIKVGYHSKSQPFSYLYSRIRQKVWQVVFKIIGNQFDASIKSLVLYSQELKAEVLKRSSNLYIGHNLGVLPAIVKASEKYNAKCIFDFEDFHRGENESESLTSLKIKTIEEKYIPLVNTLTAASILIKQEYLKYFKKNITTINNCFSVKYISNNLKINVNIPLKLFWFSQYIGKKRGLETVLYAMSQLPTGSVSLTLMGFATSHIKQYFQKINTDLNLNESQLIFIDPVQEKEIAKIASEHHIGLCSEYAHIKNRDLCLTNKIFFYLLAGNALLISDTKDQKYFIQENPNIGQLYIQENVFSLVEAIRYYYNNPSILNTHRINALQLARNKYNWELEQIKFLAIVRNNLFT